MLRLLAIFVLSPLLLGGAALAQSFDAPSIPGFSGIPGIDVPQIDPPSLDLSTGPSDDGIASGISEALVTTAAGLAEALNPDFLNPLFANPDLFNPDLFNPDAFDETDPGVALLELLAAVEEAARRGLQQGRLLLDSDFGP